MVRIIAGSAKGRRLKTVKGTAVRPTADKVKGAVFNMLSGVIEGCDFLDLFSGNGSVGIEALSRGASRAVFIDNDQRCVNITKQNLAACGFSGEGVVIKGNTDSALGRLHGERFDVVFADPPYCKELARNLLSRMGECSILKNSSLALIEHSKRDVIEQPEGFIKVKEKKYGDTAVSLYRYADANAHAKQDDCHISRNF